MRRMIAPRSLLAVFIVSCVMALLWSPAAAQVDDGPRLRVINAMYQTDAVDVFVNGAAIVEGLAYGEASDYMAIESGELQVAINLSGDASPLIEEAVDFEAGSDNTLLLLGDAEAIDYVILTDDTSPPAGDMAKISFVNANYDGLDLSLLLGDGAVVAEGLPYSDASDYVEIAAGAYDLVVEVLDDGAEFATQDGASFEAQTTYSIVAIGVPDDAGILVLEDQPRTGPAEPTTAEDSTTTPAATSPAATSPTAAASPTGGSGTPATTATSAATGSAVATHTPVPNLPDTGFGGLDADDDGSSLTPLLITFLVVILALVGVRLVRRPVGR